MIHLRELMGKEIPLNRLISGCRKRYLIVKLVQMAEVLFTIYVSWVVRRWRILKKSFQNFYIIGFWVNLYDDGRSYQT